MSHLNGVLPPEWIRSSAFRSWLHCLLLIIQWKDSLSDLKCGWSWISDPSLHLAETALYPTNTTKNGTWRCVGSSLPPEALQCGYANSVLTAGRGEH
ncbi:hypothetical protein SRHO_G00233000 [Serrasalmus rhombeus]